MQQRKARNCRLAVFSVLGGCLVYLFGAYLVGEIKGRSILWGDISSWPWFVRDFWPLDIVACCGFLWLVSYVVVTFNPRSNDRLALLAIRVGIGFGAICGLSTVGVAGWYFALKVAVLLAVAAVCLAAILAVIAAMIDFLFVRCGGWVWRRVRGWRVFRPFIIAGNWLSARDTPGEAPEDPSRR
ncbi:MAG TPA: hypothetical protein VFZ58_00450 [Candidatus Saccharimonadales bacterium]